jgi:hypothetical protein
MLALEINPFTASGFDEASTFADHKRRAESAANPEHPYVDALLTSWATD